MDVKKMYGIITRALLTYYERTAGGERECVMTLGRSLSALPSEMRNRELGVPVQATFMGSSSQ
jgi:hypothetical protein